MDEQDIASCRRWLDEIVEVDSRSGLYDEANIVAAIEEIIEAELGEQPEILAEYAARVREGLRAHDEAERGWHEVTANDRLDAAFDDLNQRGIIAGQALGSTRQEGWALIGQLGLDREEAGASVRGCAFYHRQDLERGIVGGGLMIAFGAWDSEADEDFEDVGREVVHVLRHHGLDVTWNGAANSRIVVEPFTWRRRVHTASPGTFSPAPPLPLQAEQRMATCAICGGKGWVPRARSGSELCACQKS